ncbi:redoxin family protein [Taibaiella koreensis]|uniref:redoxin family protein n=1 Tax=Taibaiella koreensis TaxID=1268548 RepID=UPI000E59C2B9|nr:redoxin family protein [Taibaiella koreensis]
MKKLLGLFVGTALMSTSFAQSGSLAIGSGYPSQPSHLSDVFSGQTPASLKELKTGKGLLVMFTCNTCPFVLKNAVRTKDILAMAKAKGLAVALINSNEAQRGDADAPAQMLAYGKKEGYTSYYIDQNSELANSFGASHTPEVFLFDGKTDKLVYKGAMDDNPSDPASAKEMYLKNAIDHMLAGKAIEPAETKSVGCSIKRIKKS